MLFHSALHWPKEPSLSHWLMAMDHALWVWNNLPMNDGSMEYLQSRSSHPRNPEAILISEPHMSGDPHLMSWIRKWLTDIMFLIWSPRLRQGEVPWIFQGTCLKCRLDFKSVYWILERTISFMLVKGVEKDQCATLDRVDWLNLIACQGGS